MIIANGHYVLIRPRDVTETDEVLKRAKSFNFELQADSIKREQAATTLGTLVSIGPDAWRAFKSEEPWAKVGDVVYYPRHTGNSLTDPSTGETLVLMTDERVIATYTETEEE